MKEELKKELKKEKKKLARMSFGQKIEYIFDYYKFPIIGVVVAVALIVSVVNTWLNNKPLAFYAMFLNGVGTGTVTASEEMEQQFADYAGIDDGATNVVIDTTASFNPNVNSQFSMAENAKIAALFASHDLDAMIIDPGVFTYYALSKAFADLRTVLPEEEFREYESQGKIYYIDAATQRKMAELDAGDIAESDHEREIAAMGKGETEDAAAKNGEKASGAAESGEANATGADLVELEGKDGSQDAEGEKTISKDETLGEMEQLAAEIMGEPDVIAREDFVMPDPDKMEDPIPVGIVVDDFEKIASSGYFAETVPVFGIPAVSDRRDVAIQFLEYLKG